MTRVDVKKLHVGLSRTRRASILSAPNLIAVCSACHLAYHAGGLSNVSLGQLSLLVIRDDLDSVNYEIYEFRVG